MPKILELKVIDGELWCRVGKLGEFENGISLWTPEDQQWHHKDSYKSGFEDAKNQWQPIETAPKDGTEILWCSKHSKSMHVIRYPYYAECYDDKEGVWMPLPRPPETKD